MGSAQIWSTIHQQLRVPNLPPDMSFTDWASCPQQVPLVMMRPVVLMAQSMITTLYNITVNAMYLLKYTRSSIVCVITLYCKHSDVQRLGLSTLLCSKC